MPLHHSRSSQNGPPPNKRDHPKAKRDQFKKQHQQQSKKEPEVIIDPLPKFDINEVGPHPGLIEPCRAYVFEHRIQECLKKLGTEMKDENWRITGVNLIAQMMKTLGLPTKTFNTASTVFHRFRLQHSLDSGQYQLMDATAAALYLASKIEDTAKRPNQIVCAGYNGNVPPTDQRQPEDDFFDNYADRVVDLESFMLEATSFEFDTRHPQQLAVKILQVEFDYDFNDESKKEIFRTTWAISMDLNYTFALLKQTTSTLAISCVELTHRLLGLTSILEMTFPSDVSPIESGHNNLMDVANRNPYARFSTSRSQVSETLMDLLDLYTLTTHRNLTFIGSQIPLEIIMDVRITLNDIAEAHNLPRYAHWRENDSGLFVTPPYVHALKVATRQQQALTQGDENSRPGSGGSERKDGDTQMESGNGNATEKPKVVAVRRFILQPAEAVKEVEELDHYFVTKEEEYEKEHEIQEGWETASEAESDDGVKRKASSPSFGKYKRR